MHKNPRTGHRVVNAGLCTTNADVRRLTLVYLKKQLETHDAVEFGGPDWNNRNGGFKCECDVCMNRASYETLWQDIGGLPPCFGRIDRYLDQRIWEFNLWLAKRIHAWDPEKGFIITSYQYTWRALPGMAKGTFPPSVTLQVADTGTFFGDYAKLNETLFPNCTPGRRLAWKKVHNSFSIYNYFWFIWPHAGPGPKMSMAVVAAQHGLYRQLGVRGLYYCSTPTNWGLEGPQYYLDYRLRMDAKADPEAVLADYCTHLYGPAADEMKAFYEELEEVLNSYTELPEGKDLLRDGGGPPAVYTKRWTEENVRRVMTRLVAAEKAAAGDAMAAARVSLSRPCMEWVDHTSRVSRQWKRWQADPTEGNKSAWGKAVAERIAWIDATIAKTASGHYEKLGLPDPFYLTDRRRTKGVREALIHFGNRGKANIFETGGPEGRAPSRP